MEGRTQGAVPRVTIADIEANIASEHYFTAAEGVIGAGPMLDMADCIDNPLPGSLRLLTFCVLVLRNGFTVTGESYCVSPDNFDAERGREVARENAAEKIWTLLGFELKQRLAEKA
ncbi:Gp49 family protein [Pusillimonas sp. SM2304]|uniref:Gp49 family protein n=1 Tax=Pusillimonas sp. SM2304 TaxID=3073241 RepID=UPI002876C9F5|nr:Gp49 family protein [Pusillimonas sp. SM2304]MDS1141742.1 Gp49 family protein [Pusillimonas sp. SM2304]